MRAKPAGRNASWGGIGSDAVRARTGRSWSEWIAVLDKAGAAGWPHKQIARFVHDQFGCSGWWSQMVTVGYEQAKGLRVPHQTARGFSASVSKTVAVPVADLYRAWSDAKLRNRWLIGAKRIAIRTATPKKSMRITWTDGTTSVEVGFCSKGAGKSQVAVQHSKLQSEADVALMKKCWKGALEKLAMQLESSAGESRRTPARR